MQPDHPPHTGNHSGLDRRTFFRRALGDARSELAQQDAPVKIIETGLLTAMGVLGLTHGLACLGQAEVTDLRVTSRGVDPAALIYIQDHFYDLQDECFASTQGSALPFETAARVICAGSPAEQPLNQHGLQVLIHWRMGKEMAGLIGLGRKISESCFEDEEINFVLNLTDSMVEALQTAKARAMLRTLENDLQQAREQIREGALRNEATRKELERSLFRLSGFNDIFQELSGLKESARVIESFLLVLIGIFSSRSGSILYHDGAADKARIAVRGSDAPLPAELTPEQIRTQIDAVFATRRASILTPMQADILTAEHLPGSSLLPTKESLIIVFKLDEAAKGMLCLGPRLVDSRYGSRERELLLAFTQNFMVFLKNSKSFETIQRLNAEQEQKNIALQQTVQALSASKKTITSMERAGEHIKTLIGRTMARSVRVSLIDICSVLVAGVVLGLVYNFASPGGIALIPVSWRQPAVPQVDIHKAEQLYRTQSAVFVDARPTEFYNQGHITAALNLPPALFDFIYMMRFNRADPEQAFVVYGRTISRRYDEEVAHRLRDRGHPNVVVLTAALDQWHLKGLPIQP